MHTGRTIGLILMSLLLAAAGLGSARPARLAPPGHEIDAAILVDASVAWDEVNPLLFGQNFGPMMNTTAPFVERYQAAGVRLLRFPAGNYGDENDLFPNNLDELAMLADALDAEVSVQARLWRKGTPEKAAELVRYANIEKGYNFRYWEIGNEPDLYMGDNRPHSADEPVYDVQWYNTQFRAFTQAMKAVDPTIQVVGPAVTGGWRDWMPEFIRANGDIVDVLSWHYYGHGNELDDQAALETAAKINDQVGQIRAWWKDPKVNPLGYQRPVPPLFLSEYNVSWATSVRAHLGTQVAALWNAELLGRMADLGVAMGGHFALQGLDWQGMVGMQPDDLRPVYGVYQMFSHWGTTQISTQSPEPEHLPAFASRAEDGTVTVLVINKEAEAVEGEVQVSGIRPARQARVLLQDAAHLAEELEPVAVRDGGLEFTFPPYSVTLFIIPEAPFNPLWAAGAAVLAVLLVGGLFVFLRGRRAAAKEDGNG